MLLVDSLQQMSRAQRALNARRWEIDTDDPMRLAARATEPAGAMRLLRAVSQAGAPNLVRILIEFAGYPLAAQTLMEAEAAVLREWGLLVETKGGWMLPVDLALALRAQRQTERYFLAPLLAAVEPRSLRRIFAELKVFPQGGELQQIVVLATKIIEQAAIFPLDNEVRKAAWTVANLQSAAMPRLGKVEVVEGSAGQRFRITLDGVFYEITPREIAELVGHPFRDVTVRAQPSVAPSLGRMPTFAALETSALLVFPSQSALLEAMRSPRFASMVIELVGQQRVLIRADMSPIEIREELMRMGFEGVIDAGSGGS